MWPYYVPHFLLTMLRLLTLSLLYLSASAILDLGQNSRMWHWHLEQPAAINFGYHLKAAFAKVESWQGQREEQMMIEYNQNVDSQSRGKWQSGRPAIQPEKLVQQHYLKQASCPKMSSSSNPIQLSRSPGPNESAIAW